jgi:hypothetical protein
MDSSEQLSIQVVCVMNAGKPQNAERCPRPCIRKVHSC